MNGRLLGLFASMSAILFPLIPSGLAFILTQPFDGTTFHQLFEPAVTAHPNASQCSSGSLTVR